MVAVCSGSMLWSIGANAEPSQPTKDSSDPPLQGDGEREVPDYDGRGDPTDAGDVAIWVPRVVLSPLYFVSEFVLRRPLGWLATTAEKNHWPARFGDFFSFGPENNMRLQPTAFFDFGLRPSVGLIFTWKDFVDDGTLGLRAAYGGRNWFTTGAKIGYRASKKDSVALKGSYSMRPDWVFYGLGPLTSADDVASFYKQQADGSASYSRRLPRSSNVETTIGVRRAEIDASRGGSNSIEQGVAEGRFALPPGANQTYTILYQRVHLNLDSRKLRLPDDLPKKSDFVSPPGGGVRLSLRGEHASNLKTVDTVDPGNSRRQQWIQYGGTLGGFVDLTEEQRVVGLQLVSEFVDPIGNATDVPFTEQVSLGGSMPLRGALDGRLVDRSSVAARLTYQWPIWVWLDGSAFYDVGNVFGEHLDGFEGGLLRSSFGFGIKGTGARDHSFEMLLAFLTETVDEGHQLDSIRFVIGGTSGF